MRSCDTPRDSFSKRHTFCDSSRFTSPLSPPMLRTSTNAASPGLPDIRMAAGLMVSMTYCSGLPMVSATIFDSDASSAFRLSSVRTTVVSSLKRGISTCKVSRRIIVWQGRVSRGAWVRALVERSIHPLDNPNCIGLFALLHLLWGQRFVSLVALTIEAGSHDGPHWAGVNRNA